MCLFVQTLFYLNPARMPPSAPEGAIMKPGLPSSEFDDPAAPHGMQRQQQSGGQGRRQQSSPLPPVAPQRRQGQQQQQSVKASCAQSAAMQPGYTVKSPPESTRPGASDASSSTPNSPGG